MPELLLQSHGGEDSMWMVNYKKCPHFLFPTSILVGGNYDLLRNTQNTNGAMLKEMEETDLQPQSVTSKYWCRKDFQFRKAVETQHAGPPQVRVTVGEKSSEPTGCGSEAVQAGGRRQSGQMEEAFGANHTRGWHRQWAESEEILLSRETESIRTGGENPEGKPRTWAEWRSRVMWGECVGILHAPPARLQASLPWSWPGGWILRTALHSAPVPSAASWFHLMGATLRKSEDQQKERFVSSRTPAYLVSVPSPSPLTATAVTGSHRSYPPECAWSRHPTCASPEGGHHPSYFPLTSCSHLCK